MLPTTILMLGLSARSGALAQRVGPRLQLAVGPVLTGAGLLLLTRIGPDAEWVAEVLPGALLLGLGPVTFVAAAHRHGHGVGRPGPVERRLRSEQRRGPRREPGRAGRGSAVSGLSSATGGDEITDAYRAALLVAAGLAALAGPLMLFGLSRGARSPRTPRRLHCAVDGPPLQPDPDRCPVRL